MSDTSIAKKLLIKPGNRVLLLPPRTATVPSFGALPEGADVGENSGGDADVVLLFVESRADQESRQQAALEAARSGGIVWVCYPKKSSQVRSDLSRDVVWQTMQPTGWRPVTQVAIDDTWSALRMRPESEVQSRRG